MSFWIRFIITISCDPFDDHVMLLVGIVRELVQEMDPELYEFFEETECRDYLFCHRWRGVAHDAHVTDWILP